MRPDDNIYKVGGLKMTNSIAEESDRRFDDLLANRQKYALQLAIHYFNDFMSYAALGSRYAIPGESDNVQEDLLKLHVMQYDEEYPNGR